MTDKSTLRAVMLEKRNAASAGFMQTARQAICDNFFTEFDLSSIKSLHIFLSIPEKNELNTWPIIKRIWNEHPEIQLAVPVTPPGAKELQHRLLTPKTELLRSKWGIDEPTTSSPLIPEKEIDLVLVPLLAFDLNGHRVGYGKGYYDKFLSKCRSDIKKIGLSVFEPVKAIADAASWDIPLNQVITPDKVYSFL